MKVGIIGVGLIGGSVGMALKRSGRHTVMGYDDGAAVRDAGAHCVDHFAESVEQLAAESDLIILAVPIGEIKNTLSKIEPGDNLITDVSSVKRAVVRAAEEVYGKVPENFVFGHPIAGREKSGAQAARADLYEKQWVILTPLKETDSAALDQVADLWRDTGAKVEYLDVDEHDKIFALSSHIPHILAYTMVNCLCSDTEPENIHHYAAGGFRDLTRIAASKPELWRDICLSNREHVIAALQSFGTELEHIRTALETEDAEYLQRTFELANQHKKIIDKQ